MRKNRPLHWIEEAEERQVVAVALFERLSRPSWWRTAQAAAAPWRPQADRAMPQPPADWPLLHAQRELCRAQAQMPASSDDDEDYSGSR